MQSSTGVKSRIGLYATGVYVTTYDYQSSQLSFHDAPIFRLLLKIAVF